MPLKVRTIAVACLILLGAIVVPDAPTQLKTYLPDFVVLGTGR